jgi:hypothetical protein
MNNNIKLSSETEDYLNAQRSLVLSNGDKKFQDSSTPSDALVLDVIKSYGSVFLKPMLARVEKKG